MSRRVLSIIVGVLGFVIGSASILGMTVMGSLFADARTENITGPGVDVFLRTPFPLEGGTVALDVEARGGSRAGIDKITVREGETTLTEVTGAGATWGYSINKGKSRGSETMQVLIGVPPARVAGQTLSLELQVAYVVAMSSGAGSFQNDRRTDVVRLDVAIHSPSSRRFGQLKQIGAALGLLAIWILAVWGIAKLYALASLRDPHLTAGEMEGISLVLGIFGGGVIGYWMFALRITAALEVDSTILAALLTLVWIGLPLVIAWTWRKRHDARIPRAAVMSPRTQLEAALAGARAMGIGHDAALASTLLLETSRMRIASLLEAAPALAAVDTWIEETLPGASTSKDPILRRRIVALNWCLVAAGPAILNAPAGDARAELIDAIGAATTITSDEDREALAARVQAALRAP